MDVSLQVANFSDTGLREANLKRGYLANDIFISTCLDKPDLIEKLACRGGFFK